MALGLLTWKGEGAESVDVCGWIYRPRIYPYCQGNKTTGLSHSEWEGCTWHLWWSQPPSPQGCCWLPFQACSSSFMPFSISALPGLPGPFEGLPSPPHTSISAFCERALRHTIPTSVLVRTWVAWTCLWVDLGFHPLLQPGTRIYTVPVSLRRIHSQHLERLLGWAP